MTIYSIYILSKSGGLIFNTDQNMPKIELEKTFSYPIPYKLVYENNRIVVSFGQRDGIKGKWFSNSACYDVLAIYPGIITKL